MTEEEIKREVSQRAHQLLKSHSSPYGSGQPSRDERARRVVELGHSWFLEQHSTRRWRRDANSEWIVEICIGNVNLQYYAYLSNGGDLQEWDHDACRDEVLPRMRRMMVLEDLSNA